MENSTAKIEEKHYETFSHSTKWNRMKSFLVKLDQRFSVFSTIHSNHCITFSHAHAKSVRE